MTKQKCYVGGRLGMIVERYTYTVDIYMFKSKMTKTGVNKRYVKMLPPDKKGIPNQLTFNYEA
jgi:hypothetical protein